MTAVGEEMPREPAASRVIGRAEHHRARAVAEQDGRVPAAGRLVEPARVHLGADQEDAAVGAGADPGVGHGETVQEAAALVPHVDRGDVADAQLALQEDAVAGLEIDRKSTRLNSSHLVISYAVFCLKKKKHMPCLLAARPTL